MINESEITTQIEKLKKERDTYIAQANQQIAAYSGAIAALEQLIAPKEVKDGEQKDN